MSKAASIPKQRTVGQQELIRLLLVRAEAIGRYVENRIPDKFRGAISIEDVLQEIWITAFNDSSGFRLNGPQSLDSWLYFIADRTLVSVLRKFQALKRGGNRFRVRAATSSRSSILNLLSIFSSPQRTPSSETASREAEHAVQIALSSLPSRYRRAIWLSYFQGLSPVEIAGEMQESIPAIHGLIYRGKKMLKLRMGRAAKYFSDA